MTNAFAKYFTNSYRRSMFSILVTDVKESTLVYEADLKGTLSLVVRR